MKALLISLVTVCIVVIAEFGLATCAVLKWLFPGSFFGYAHYWHYGLACIIVAFVGAGFMYTINEDEGEEESE